jgi:type 1 fimbriae regulatory protein FimE
MGRSPGLVNRKVDIAYRGFCLTRPKNKDVRGREYLTEAEVEDLIKAARSCGRYGHRDATMILMAYWHGLRVGELVALRWDQVALDAGRLYVSRLKKGTNQLQPLGGESLRALRKLKREWPGRDCVFQSERGAPLKPDAVRKIVARAGCVAGLPFPVHPHMLRHGCGYRMVNDGNNLAVIQDYLGHKNIHHTRAYSQLSAHKFDCVRRN